MAAAADDVWQLLGELIQSQKETERLLREQSKKTDRQQRPYPSITALRLAIQAGT